MADEIKKTVITEFIAETSQYTSAMAKVKSANEDVAESSKEVEDQSKKTSATMETSIGGTAGVIGKLVPQLKGVTNSIKDSEEAAKKFGTSTRAALIASGVGAFVILLGKLVSVWKDVGDTADEELTFVQKKVKDAGNAVADWFKGVKEGIAEWIENNQKLVLSIAKIYNFMTFGASNVLAKYILQLKDEADAHEANKLALEEESKAKSFAIQQAERALALAGTIKENTKEQLRLEEELLWAKMQNAKADEVYALETAILVNNAKQEAIRLQEIENERLRIRFERIKENSKQDTEALKIGEVIAEPQIKLNTSVEESIKLTQQSIAAKIKLRTTEQENAAISEAAQKKFNDVIFSTMLWQKANAVKQAVVMAGQAILAVWKDPLARFPQKVIQSAIVAGITYKQIKDIAGVQFTAPAFADGGVIPAGGGMIRGNRHSQGGVRFSVGGYMAEAEGGEFIINRKATRQFFPVLNAINNTGKYQDGGVIAPNMQQEQLRINAEAMKAYSSSQPVLVLEDFRRAANRLSVVESLSGVRV